MTEIRLELLRLLILNYAEQWVPEHIAFVQLASYGDRLIPGLIGCLEDYDSEVRQLAISLLDEAGLRAAPALPSLIQAVADPDRLVRLAAADCLVKFGPQAVDAVPLLESWLQDEPEYVPLMAALTIIRLDLTKKDELVPIIQAALDSENPMVRGLAEEYIADK